MKNSHQSISALSETDIAEALAVFKAAYIGMDVPKSEYEWFKSDLHGSFDDAQNYQLSFFKIEANDKILAFAAIGKSGFMRCSWELRWGTTRPEHQKQGLMSTLTDYRIDHAREHSAGIPGIIHICSRSPNLYLKKGFQNVYSRGPENKAHYLVKYINQDLQYSA